MLRHGILGQGIGVAEAVIPKFSSRPPWEGFSWIRLSKGWPMRSSNSRMAKTWNTMKTLILSIVIGSPNNPTTFKKESSWTFEEFIGRD
jgi:hypothetical protein